MSALPEDLTRAPPARIAAARERNFQTMMDLCFAAHPFYQREFARAGLRREHIRSLADLVRLPLTRKADYMAEPDAFMLRLGDDHPLETRVVWDTMHTTGTSSGKPTPFVSTAYDFYNILLAARRMMELRRVATSDIVANLCPLTVHPYGAYHRTIAAANAMKIPVVSPLPGKPSPHFHLSADMTEVVDTVARTRATILWGVSSYVRRVILAAQEAKADFSAVRMAFVTGETVSNELRRDMTERLKSLGARDPWVSVSYGATEMQGGLIECCPDSGYHNPAPEQFHIAIVDPETHAPMPDGASGLVTLTHLDRRGTVLLRYLLGDTSTQTHEACPHCGATTDRLIALPHRADDLVKVKGMLINPAVLAAALQEDPAIAEFQIVIDRENPADPLSMDRLILRIAPTARVEGMHTRIAERVKVAIGVRPEIELVERDAIYDPERSLKSKRLIDRRK
jgi:phenylacetate-CoA ligase